MQFIYPPMGARIHLPKQMDGSKGQLTVELVHSHPNVQPSTGIWTRHT